VTKKWGMDFDSKEAEEFLARIRHKAETPMGKALIRAVSPVVAEAKHLSPKDVPVLVRTITAGVDEEGPRHTVFVGTPLNYGLFQEIGFRVGGTWVKNPYLVPAIHAKKAEVQANVKAEVEKWLRS